MKILVITSVEAERAAILRGNKANPKFDVVVAGVGPIAAAIAATKALTSKKYDLVINAGIAGGFPNKADVKSVVLASEVIAADLGAETAEGFSSIEQLGFGISTIAIDHLQVKKVAEALQTAGLTTTIGPILTLSTVTGTTETTLQLTKRFPLATAEAMEGFGVALAAKEAGVPTLEIRTISNLVGPRDKAAWKIKEALSTLETVSSVLVEVF